MDGHFEQSTSRYAIIFITNSSNTTVYQLEMLAGSMSTSKEGQCATMDFSVGGYVANMVPIKLEADIVLSTH